MTRFDLVKGGGIDKVEPCQGGEKKPQTRAWGFLSEI